MRYFIICLVLLTQGCISALTIPDALLVQADSCRTQVTKVKIEEARTQSVVGIQVYKDETSALLSQAIGALTARQDPFAACNTNVVQYIQSQGRISEANARIVGNIVGVTGVVSGIYAHGDANADLLEAGGSDSTTVNAVGSRVSFAGGGVGSNNGGIPGSGGGGTDISQSSSGDLMPFTMDNIAITSGDQSYSNTRPQASTSYSPIINAAPGTQNITQQEQEGATTLLPGDNNVVQPLPMTLEECWAGGGCGAGY